MIDIIIKEKINNFGRELALAMPDFYGKVSFNIHNGVYVCSNVDQSIKPDNLKK